jgi:hypothetical protein
MDFFQHPSKTPRPSFGAGPSRRFFGLSSNLSGSTIFTIGSWQPVSVTSLWLFAPCSWWLILKAYFLRLEKDYGLGFELSSFSFLNFTELHCPVVSA